MIQTSLNIATLVDSLRPSIESQRAEAETLRCLPRELAETLRHAGAFRLSTPVERGGLELPLTTMMSVYEAFGRIDGAVAWNVWNGNLGFIGAMLDDAAADRIWADGDPIIANSARVCGGGTSVDGGFLLSGRWDMVSAIDVADWVGLFGVVLEGDGPRMTEHGPDVRAFFVPTDAIQIIDTWHTSGMRGTGSKTVTAAGVFVPQDLAISPFAPARLDRPLYRVPAFTIASCGAAPIVVGIAQAAVDELVALAPGKATDNGHMLADRPHVQSQLAAAQLSLDAARLLLHDATATIDRAATEAEPISELLRARLRGAMSHAGAVCRGVLSTCQLLASSSAVYSANRMEQLVRDGQVAAQHMILSPIHMDILGRLTLGLDAGTPVV